MVREELYRRTITYAREWFLPEARDEKEIFYTVLHKDADPSDLKPDNPEGAIADKFYAVLWSVCDYLKEEKKIEGFLKPLVSPSLSDRSSLLILLDEKAIFTSERKYWHYWSSPEELKEDLEDIFHTCIKNLGEHIYAVMVESSEAPKCPGCWWDSSTFVFRAVSVKEAEEKLKKIKEILATYKETGEASFDPKKLGFQLLCPQCFCESIAKKVFDLRD